MMGIGWELGLELGFVFAGYLAAFVLFRRFPNLPGGSAKTIKQSVSIIIPARNEEDGLPLLLADLMDQTQPPKEVICVDDGSEDGTKQIAQSFGGTVISSADKPEGWLGKSWACFSGAKIAKGDLLLFLDADVRLSKDGIKRLLHAHQILGGTVSVQPRHCPQENYEQLSLMFNLLQIGANGATMANPPKMGLYGPVILIKKEDYWQVGGHRAVAGSIVEDVALGLTLKQEGLDYHTFIGDENISFRMYPGGFKSLVQGWTKNLAWGAAEAPLVLLTLTFLWITSMTSVPVQMVRYGILGNMKFLLIYAILYGVWVIIVGNLANRVGRFRRWVVVLYPTSLCLLLWVFTNSLFKKVFRQKVIWKGRTVDPEGKI